MKQCDQHHEKHHMVVDACIAACGDPVEQMGEIEVEVEVEAKVEAGRLLIVFLLGDKLFKKGPPLRHDFIGMKTLHVFAAFVPHFPS